MGPIKFCFCIFNSLLKFLCFVVDPCGTRDVNMTREGNNVTLKWNMEASRSCSLPSLLLANINNVPKELPLKSPHSEVNFTHNFDFCKNYTLKLQFVNAAHRKTNLRTLSFDTGFPGKKHWNLIILNKVWPVQRGTPLQVLECLDSNRRDSSR